MKPTLDDWAWVSTMISQAYVGVISSNFKEISLVAGWNNWILVVLLFEENEVDTEEIRDTDSVIDGYLFDIAPRLAEGTSRRFKSEVHLEFPTALEALERRILFRLRGP
ncbi:MAG: hypothetical protein AAFO78_13675 [Pseudomonadota bacterium]